MLCGKCFVWENEQGMVVTCAIAYVHYSMFRYLSISCCRITLL